MTSTAIRLPRPAAAPATPPAWRFIAGWLASWALVGCAVALGIVFSTEIDLAPALRLSVLFAEVVGLTAFASTRVIFPLFTRLPYVVRVALEVLTLLSGTVFGSIGAPELIVIFLIALLIFGPRKLPQLGRTIGKSLAEFRRATHDLKRTLEREISEEEPSPTRDSGSVRPGAPREPSSDSEGRRRNESDPDAGPE